MVVGGGGNSSNLRVIATNLEDAPTFWKITVSLTVSWHILAANLLNTASW